MFSFHSRAFRSLLFILTTAALAGCAAETDAGDDDDDETIAEDASALSGHKKFRVMTYNLRYPQAEDTGPKRWSQRSASVVARVTDNAPDILGVQEAKRPSGDFNLANVMKTALTGAGHAYDVFDPGGGSPKLIFFRRARFEIAEAVTDANNHALPNPGESPACKDLAADKKAAWVKLRDKSTGKVYFIVNTHLVAGDCPKTRENSAVAIKKLVNARSGGLPVIIMGDMNSDPQAAGAGGEETIHILEKRGKDLTLAGDYAGSTTNARATFNTSWDFTRRDTRRIDYILIGGGKLKATGHDIDRAKNRDGISPSDHFPVVVVVGPS